MFNEKFFEVLGHEGVVAIATSGAAPHLVNTWNSYVEATDGNLLVPAGGMHRTEINISANDQVLLTFGSREVVGKRGQPGAGFLVTGTAAFLSAGEDFERLLKKFPWARAVLKIKVATVTQTL